MELKQNARTFFNIYILYYQYYLHYFWSITITVLDETSRNLKCPHKKRIFVNRKKEQYCLFDYNIRVEQVLNEVP